MESDQERTAAVQALAGSLVPGGLLFLDVRERNGSRRRADGRPRSWDVAFDDGRRLTFTSRTRWAAGRLQVDEQYDLSRPGEATRTSKYRFTMRPWTVGELRATLEQSGMRPVEIAGGVGRRTPDRLFVVAS